MEDTKDDEILHTLNAAVDPIADAFEEQEEASLFVLGSKVVQSEDDKSEDSVHTYIMVVGYYEILMEGLYAEIKGQIDAGNYELFNCFRDVVRGLEEELGIDPDDELDGDDSSTILLH
jgi:hypothetical protein